MNLQLTFCLRLIFFLTAASLLLTHCDTSPENTPENEPWTSADPLAVNYRTRYQKFSQGNLVHNPSFELGKVKQVDSLTQSIVIEGWDFVGRNIRWLKVLSDSVSEPGHYIHSGNRAIKIIRKSASETDEIGDGIISDYIRVIPGNYNLSMYLNLVDIENPKSRLGTGLYDAVDIRLIYYDKNKLAISGNKYSRYYKYNFDNSFKGLSLTRFSRIDSTGWIHIQGRSHLFPVPDGDIQDDAKYIRIFIGLKGNGTLYIDDVNYHYTRWNFTQLERLEPYFDTTFSLSQLIIPKPRSVKVLESIIYYRPYYKDIFPVILIPANADNITLQAAKRLEKHIKRTISVLTNTDQDSIPELISESINDQIRQTTITFSMGETGLFKNISKESPYDEIKDKEQGFMVYTPKDDLSVIYLIGNSPVSNYYAVQAVIQLFDNRRLLYHNANIIDYPENTLRPLLLSNSGKYALKFLQESKVARFNQIYLPADAPGVVKSLYQLNDLGIYSLDLFINLYPKAENETQSLRSIENQLNNYTYLFNGLAILDESFSGISDKADSDHQAFVNKQTADLDRIRVPIEVQDDNDNLQWQKEMQSRNYTSMPGFGNDATIWTGNGMGTWKLDEADYALFKLRNPGKTVFLDMTMYTRDSVLQYFMYDSLWPTKLAKASMFEAYDNEVCREIYDDVEKTIIAYRARNIFDEIRLQTASDFFWNPDTYNPDLSLYRALITLFGSRLTRDLLYFNDYYFKARAELILAGNPRNYQKHIRKADGYIQDMKNLLDSFAADTRVMYDTGLPKILENLLADVEKRRNSLTQSSLVAE